MLESPRYMLSNRNSIYSYFYDSYSFIKVIFDNSEYEIYAPDILDEYSSRHPNTWVEFMNAQDNPYCGRRMVDMLSRQIQEVKLNILITDEEMGRVIEFDTTIGGLKKYNSFEGKIKEDKNIWNNSIMVQPHNRKIYSYYASLKQKLRVKG